MAPDRVDYNDKVDGMVAGVEVITSVVDSDARKVAWRLRDVNRKCMVCQPPRRLSRVLGDIISGYAFARTDSIDYHLAVLRLRGLEALFEARYGTEQIPNVDLKATNTELWSLIQTLTNRAGRLHDEYASYNRVSQDRDDLRLRGFSSITAILDLLSIDVGLTQTTASSVDEYSGRIRDLFNQLQQRPGIYDTTINSPTIGGWLMRLRTGTVVPAFIAGLRTQLLRQRAWR